MTIRIDKNVPIPRMRRPGTERRYPFRKMRVGDSFFVTGRSVHALGNLTNYYRHQLGHKYLKRSRIEKGKKGVRVWRIK